MKLFLCKLQDIFSDFLIASGGLFRLKKSGDSHNFFWEEYKIENIKSEVEGENHVQNQPTEDC